MVFFVCNKCGEAIKKPKVANHLYQCRGPANLSCQDCGKDFLGKAWESHNTCVSEAQKYGGADYVAKDPKNKGRAKQDQWIECFREAIQTANVSPRVRQLLEKISSFDNIPRKEKPFNNFVSNACRLNAASEGNTLRAMWSVFETAKNKFVEMGKTKPTTPVKNNEEPSANGVNETSKDVPTSPKQKRTKDQMNGSTNGITEDEQSTPSKKPKFANGAEKEDHDKDSQDDDEGPLNGEQSNERGGDTGAGFNWKKSIKKALKKAPDNQLDFLDLCNLVKEQYNKKISEELSQDELYIQILARLSSSREKYDHIVKLKE